MKQLPLSHSHFIVGMNAGGGVRFLNEDGQQWGQSSASNVFTVEPFDTDGDGIREILHSHLTQSGPRIAIRTARTVAAKMAAAAKPSTCRRRCFTVTSRGWGYSETSGPSK